MIARHPAYLLLEDGTCFQGVSPWEYAPAPAEVVFTTNLSGYQEVFTDPSYLGQIVVMTAPMIGNYGVNEEDLESDAPRVDGVVVRELSRGASSWRATSGLDTWLSDAGIPVLAEVDTRRLTRHIRSAGAMRGVLAIGAAPDGEVRSILDGAPRMEGLDLASRAGTRQEYQALPAGEVRHHIVAYDYGMKRNILRLFLEAGCRVTVVPSSTPAERVRELGADGLFLSNGPGDPAAVRQAIPAIHTLATRGVPTFGICLGCQLVALAFGGETGKLPYGHRGGNHPVRDLHTGRVLITTQNHGFAIRGDASSVVGSKSLEVTHINLNDNTIEGVRHRDLPVLAVQYHPEAAPGPHDARRHFDEFLQTLDSQ